MDDKLKRQEELIHKQQLQIESLVAAMDRMMSANQRADGNSCQPNKRCFKCGGLDHFVRNCPKLARFDKLPAGVPGHSGQGN